MKYFDTMFSGLSQNPEGYIYYLIKENPSPSYCSDPVEDGGKYKKPLESFVLFPQQMSLLKLDPNKRINLRNIQKSISESQFK
jgi:hypothetical protein